MTIEASSGSATDDADVAVKPSVLIYATVL